MMSIYRLFGAVLSLIVGIGGLYEGIAILTGPAWPPTFSRMTQGLRDDGHTFAVFAISIGCGFILMALAQWLYYHFNYQPRSGS